jgi:hypothetical protein
MTTQMFEVVISAVGEVRDAEGNLISAEPVTATMHVTAEELAALTEGNQS